MSIVANDTPDYDPRTTCGKPCNCESYRAHLLSVGVSSAATPSRDRSQETVSALAREKRWEKDMPAYKRLRQEGLQPPRIDGSDRLEAGATSKTEVEVGRTLAGGTLRVVDEIKQLQKERVTA